MPFSLPVQHLPWRPGSGAAVQDIRHVHLGIRGGAVNGFCSTHKGCRRSLRMTTENLGISVRRPFTAATVFDAM
jgi:hypothetical protein